MFLNITASEIGNNKGSSGALVNYLEKENHLQVEKGRGLGHENWFNGVEGEISRQQVRVKIDRNTSKLGRNESKFYLINISPSQKELACLLDKYGEQGTKEKLKDFAVKVMDEYARNFKRPGIDSHKDLLWFGKYENYRYYSYKDQEVKNGTRLKGELKEGKQMHIQIIVSRKDISNRLKLSPQNNSKGKNKEHSAKLGQFNRLAFKQSGENLFDSIFQFDRGLTDSLIYANTMKNGTASQKAQMQILTQIAQHNRELANIIKDLGKSVSKGIFKTIEEMFSAAVKIGADVINNLFKPVQQMKVPETTTKSRKKKKKGQSQDQSYQIKI
ncbi:DUF5712 family protein [Pedobacter panaciterrae]